MAHVVGALETRPYLLGDKFSAADILFGGTFNLFAQNPILPKFDVIRDYAARCIDRPAYARAQALDHG
jgi:glutathione S-transferase